MAFLEKQKVFVRDEQLTSSTQTPRMKKYKRSTKTHNVSPLHEESFTILRTSLSNLNLPVDLIEELIDRHIAVSFEKDAMAFCEGNTDGMLACILSGYVNIYCPVGDGNRSLVR